MCVPGLYTTSRNPGVRLYNSTYISSSTLFLHYFIFIKTANEKYFFKLFKLFKSFSGL